MIAMFVYILSMKTITLTEEAYGRLAAWKGSPKESFSKVVEKIVPKKGTLGSILETTKTLSKLTSKQEKLLEEGRATTKSWKDQKYP